MTLATARFRGTLTLADLPDPMTVTEVARLAGIAESLAYAEVRDGRLYSRKVGRRVLVPKAAYVRWLEGTENENGEPPELRLAVVEGGRGIGRRPSRG